MAKLVCDTTNKECMVHRCKSCPGTDALKEFLNEQLCEMDVEEEFFINQWQSTDRSNLITQTVTPEEYKEIVVEQINKLTAHAYIAKCQGKYLKELKTNLKPNECIILGDFAENYQFIVQDEIQSYHWNTDQCTLHPVVIYYKDVEDNVQFENEDNIRHETICFISDDMEHDTCFVYQVQKLTSSHMKEKMPHITKVYYFSDGCGGQYKNFKNFVNLCLHYEDFAMDAEWIFFATSHGKSPCDGVGGTVKRTTARASLQRPVNNQIMDVHAMFKCCVEHIKTIRFVLIQKVDMTSVRKFLNARFENGRTVPGTRSYHHYVPLSTSKIAYKRTSEDIGYHNTFELIRGKYTEEVVLIPKFNLMDFVACKYDSFWWIGTITNIGEQDVLINFMHPHGPTMKFSWPPREDKCWVPLQNIIVVIDIPTTRSGRIYDISKQDYEKIVNKC